MTAEELLAMPDVPGLERILIRGVLVERSNPLHSPGHGGTLATLYWLFGQWQHENKRHGWESYGYGCPYLVNRDPDTLVTFDLGVVRAAEEQKHPTYLDAVPRVAVDVVELDQPRDEIESSIAFAAAAGVGQFWVVDPITEVVEVHRPDGGCRIYSGSDLIDGEPELPGFHCRVSDIFE